MIREDRKVNFQIAEVLDRILEHGVVLEGEVVISVAEVDLIYLSLKAVVASVESLEQKALQRSPGTATPTSNQ